MLATPAASTIAATCIRAASEIRQRCYNHPHRRATRSARAASAACASSARASGATAGLRALPERGRRAGPDRQPADRGARPSGRRSLRNFLVGLAVVGVLAVPGYYVVKNLMSTPITPEEFARFRYAAAGSFDTPEGVNTLSTVLGGKVLTATSAAGGLRGEAADRRVRRARLPGLALGRRDVAAGGRLRDLGQPTRIEKVDPAAAADRAARDVSCASSRSRSRPLRRTVPGHDRPLDARPEPAIRSASSSTAPTPAT